MNSLSDVGEIRRVYVGNPSTEVVNIWCDWVGKLEIYRQKPPWHFPQKFSESIVSKLLVRLKQVAQLSQRDRAAGWVSNGQKWKTGTERQYLRTI